MLIITTGGTIGGDAYPNPERAPEKPTFSWYREGADPRQTDPVIVFLRRDGLLQDGDRYASLRPRDSKEITLKTLRRIADLIVHEKDSEVLVTIGTDEIVPCAKDLSFQLGQMVTCERGFAGKRITLLGAMVPLLNDPSFGGSYHSDGIPNLTAIMKNRTKPLEGVNICLSAYGYPGDTDGVFKPYLYPPNELSNLEKFHDPNSARSRLLHRSIAKQLRSAQLKQA
jgi:hypothetical protein